MCLPGQILRILFLALLYGGSVGTYSVFGQNQTTFRQLSVAEGLSQNSVISIAQDSIGYLWFATQDGLNKYDGRSFTVYNFQFVDITNYEYSHLGKVYVDRLGKVWILPISKVPHFYDPDSDAFLPLPLLSDVSIMFQDSQKNYWFGTYNSGLYIMRKDSSTVENIVPHNEIMTVQAITEDADGNVWITADEAIVKYNANTHKFVPFTPKLDQRTVFSAITVDINNQVWVGSYGNGLWTKRRDSDVFEKVIGTGEGAEQIPSNLYVLSLLMDSNHNLWIGSYGSGLFKVDRQQHTVQNFEVEKHNPRTIHYNDILSMYEDYTGAIWFGTDGAGVSYHDKFLDKFNYFTNFLTPENVNIDVVRSVVLDRNGNIWIGTSGKGLTVYNSKSKSWKTYFSTERDDGLSDNRIVSLFVEDSGVIWIGTQDGGLNILSINDSVTQYLNHPSVPFAGTTVWKIHQDKRKRFWLGTRRMGFFLFDKAKGVQASFSSDLGNFPSNNIRTIIDGDQDILWIGTDDQGVFSFNTITHEYKELQVQKEDLDGLRQFQVKALAYDENKIVWIATGGDGLKAYNTKSKEFYRYTTADGLANNVIYSVMQDKANNFWLSSNKGIIKFRPKADLSLVPEVTNYTNYDGLSNEFNTGAYFKATNGELYFGALDGIYWFDPAKMEESTIIPKTVITNFEIFNEKHVIKKDMRLNADQNTLSFGFSSMQFSLPSKNKYQFKLEGYEKEWNKVDNMNLARYTNLPHGTYTFKVKSSNYDGKWNEVPATFNFTINKPWYLSIPALLAYLLFAFLLAFVTYYYFKSRWQMQMELKMEYDRSDRLKQLNDYKTKLYTNLSHEFRTPLTLIAAPVKKLLKGKNLPDSAIKDLSLVERSADRLVGLVDQLLELSKLESGFVKLKVTHGNLELFLNALVASFIPLAIEKKIKLKAKVTNINFAWYDTDVLEKLLNNLLINAIKYTPKIGSIDFHVHSNKETLYITLENDVHEIKEQEIPKLFDRFYQVNDQSDGFGIGLSMVKELVALTHGEIGATYVKGKRIRFTLKIPIGRTSFTDDEIDLAQMEVSKANVLFNGDQQFAAVDKSKKIILLVEDNQDLRTFTKTLFEDKYKVIEAENGTIGIQKAFHYIPDIIVSDIMMPETDGIVLCTTLKEDERTSHIPIILLTAKTGEENELIGLKTGADAYMLKPYTPDKIIIWVEKLIESRIKLQKRYQQNVLLKPKEIAFTSADEKFFKRLQQVLDEHLFDPEFNAISFSSAIGMSRMQLHRKLNALTGLSTTAFITSQRLKSALLLLQKNNSQVAEVAYATGFGTPSYFIKCFKKAYGNTPSKYMEINNL